MADRRTVAFIKIPFQPRISHCAKGRGSNKYLAWTAESNTIFATMVSAEHTGTLKRNAAYVVCLSETEIHEYSAQALEELEMAEDSLRRAQDRVDALRMFAHDCIVFQASPL